MHEQAEIEPTQTSSIKAVNSIQHTLSSNTVEDENVSEMLSEAVMNIKNNSTVDGEPQKKSCLWVDYKSPVTLQYRMECKSNQPSVDSGTIIWEDKSAAKVHEFSKKKPELRTAKRRNASGMPNTGVMNKKGRLQKAKLIDGLNEPDENHLVNQPISSTTTMLDMSCIMSPERSCVLADAERKSNSTAVNGMLVQKSVTSTTNDINNQFSSSVSCSISEKEESRKPVNHGNATMVLSSASCAEFPTSEPAADQSCVADLSNSEFCSDDVEDLPQSPKRTECLDKTTLDQQQQQHQQQCDQQSQIDEGEDPFIMPIISRRSSRRLRRTSLQLFRKTMETDSSDLEVRSDENCCQSADDINERDISNSEKLLVINGCVSNEQSDVQNASQTLKIARQRKRRNLSSAISNCKAVQDLEENVSESNGNSLLMNNNDALTVVAKTDTNPLSFVQDTGDLNVVGLNMHTADCGTEAHHDMSSDSTESKSTIASGRSQRRCTLQQPAVYVEPSFQARSRRKKPGPSVEDIYRSRLWRSQMPEERMWEPIPETPITDPRSGSERMFASRKVHCVMKFDSAPNQARLRQRRQKAVSRGWKPLTKKRLAALDQLLAAKLAEFDQELGDNITE